MRFGSGADGYTLKNETRRSTPEYSRLNKVITVISKLIQVNYLQNEVNQAKYPSHPIPSHQAKAGRHQRHDFFFTFFSFFPHSVNPPSIHPSQTNPSILPYVPKPKKRNRKKKQIGVPTFREPNAPPIKFFT